MQVLIVKFNLDGVSDADYRASCEAEAGAFATIPGLISKIWLADEAGNTYGGVYTFTERAALDAYVRSDLYNAIATDPNLRDVTASAFDVLEGPTGVTHGLTAVAA